MNSYDIVFIGHTATGEIVPFEDTPSFGTGGGAAFFGATAAVCCAKKIAMVTKMSKEDAHVMEPLKAMGIDIYLQPSSETTHMKIVYPTANVDERQIFQTKSAGFFRIEEMPPLEPGLIHLGALSDQEFTLEFMKGLKARGFRLSIDMQGFLWEVDQQTRAIRYKDLPEKEEILHMVETVKLDVAEAKALTGTDDLKRAAAIVEDWGCLETIITRSDGVLVYKNGESYFARFSNRSVEGRTGRGDATIGAYLARKIDHSIEDAIKFAGALASIKMEAKGPFMGTLEDVLKRMEETEVVVP
ncbi:MAG: PfkB family carbohydrate kinase [Proteobacteria bacterium]|nr:PfkB family carbohydrate kinase [Pseudomonadota bacterium]